MSRFGYGIGHVAAVGMNGRDVNQVDNVVRQARCGNQEVPLQGEREGVKIK